MSLKTSCAGALQSHLIPQCKGDVHVEESQSNIDFQANNRMDDVIKFSPPVCLTDFQIHAQQRLPKQAYDYFAGGSGDECTVKENKEAFKRFKLRPRMLRGITAVDMSTTLLGQNVSMPICVAPTALQKLAHPEGELATARATANANTCMTVSMVSTSTMEDVAAAAPDGLRWFQLYILKDQELNKQLVVRAERAGYKAIVLTVDVPVGAPRRNLSRNPFVFPPGISLPHFGSASRKWPTESLEPAISWDSIKWLKSCTKLPIVVKGILTAEDATLAVEHGVHGIIVSNHGGRQLDEVQPTVEALPEVIAAVKGQVEVYMDCGVRLGTDVLKALALGARAVFIGRPVVWGLAYQGEQGVEKVLELLREEFRIAMILSGCASLSDISRSLVVYQPTLAL